MNEFTTDELHEMYQHAIIAAGGDLEFLAKVQAVFQEIIEDSNEFTFNEEEEDGDPGPPVGTSGQEIFDGIFNMVVHLLIHYHSMAGPEKSIELTKAYLQTIIDGLGSLATENKQEG